MNVILLVLGVVGLWWAFLSFLLFWGHRHLVPPTQGPKTAEQQEEIRQFKATVPRHEFRGKALFAILPFLIPSILIMLPFHVYGWIVKDQHKHE